MLAQIYAAILVDRYQAAIDKAHSPGDLDSVNAMLDDAEERGALVGEELDWLRKGLQTKKAAIGETNSDGGSS